MFRLCGYMKAKEYSRNDKQQLASGKTIPDLVLADNEELVIVRGAPASNEQDLPFRIREIVDLY